MKKIFRLFYQTLIKPKSENPELKRKEFILNTLLSGLLIANTYSIGVSLGHHLHDSRSSNIESLIATLVFLMLLVALKINVMKRHVNLASHIFVTFIFVFATAMCLTWGFTLPISQLLFALCVVTAGILISSKSAFIVALLASVTTFVIAWMQTSTIISPNTYWMNLPSGLGDAYGFIAIFSIMGLVSWLSNREIERSLLAERLMTQSLETERNNLEQTLEERSKQLEQAQLVRVLELQRFAELGKLSASFMHQVATPLTAASLNLEQLNRDNYISIVKRTRKNLDHLEKYLDAARHQLVGGGVVSLFNVNEELIQVINLFKPRSNRDKVVISFKHNGVVLVRGDSIKFNQLIANLIGNAIDSYDGITRVSKRKVIVTLRVTPGNINITIEDHGTGLNSVSVKKVFDAFYTTKTHDKRGMGIGLTIARQYIENDFAGTITVKSSIGKGTVFTISIPNTQTA